MRAAGLRGTVMGLLATLAAGPALAQAPGGPRERERRKLQEQVGIDKLERRPPPDAAPPATGEPAPAPGPAAPAAPEAPSSPPAAPPAVPFAGRVHDYLLTACRACHVAGGSAAASRLVLDGNAAHDHAAVRRLVDVGAPRRSLLLLKATGNQHGGGATLAAGSDPYRRLVQWIAAGAALSARPADADVAAAPASASASATRPRPARPAATRPHPLPVPVAAPAPAVAVPESAAPPQAVASTAAAPESATAPAGPPAVAVALHQELVRACLPCHRQGAPAGVTRYRLTGDLSGDLAASRTFVDLVARQPGALGSKAAGQTHGGGALWPPGGPGAQALAAWISAGAPDREAPPATTSSAAAPAAPAAPAPVSVAPAPPPATPVPGAGPPAAGPGAPPHGHGHGHGLTFGDSFTLNGRFDVNLERRGFEGDPFDDAGKTALTSYHHFLFLGRQSVDDPFLFTAELLSLEFYEAGLRVGPRGRSWRLHLRAGKLLVPFGNEPLFHQSYGGHAGFDQRVLPAVWASEGLAASGLARLRWLTLTGDLYGVRGHALRRAGDVLNLQSDISPGDDARPALGLRLGAAVGPFTGYYSGYFNPLGHDRRLYMQALDLSLWRLRGLPVLDRLVLGMGVLRADVSGGGAGADYYHFASYWLARAYACDWLYLQYRQGLRTFDNKRNLTFDARRRGREDGSTHNFTLAARYRGLVVSLSYYLNLEKADEVDDDLARLAVAYEF
jgi:hypothetical protein